MLIIAPSAALRLARAEEWLAGRARGEEVLVLGATLEAATDLCRDVARRVGAAFGWRRATLPRLARELAAPRLAELGLAPAGPLALEALAARVVHRLGPLRLGRFAPIADRPGLARALAGTLAAVRLAGLGPRASGLGQTDPELAEIAGAFEHELAEAKLADRAIVYEIAAKLDAGPAALLLLDVPITSAAERDLVAALVARAPDALATSPAGDERSAAALTALLGPPETLSPEPTTALACAQRALFTAELPTPVDDDSVTIFSAPGESRECIEIARRVRREAERGIPFDRMAILLRAPATYRAHLEEALRRAGIPACFSAGTLRPDPAGRAFLALIACADDDLSARRFAEYLSLGEHPHPEETCAPPPATDSWVPAEDETPLPPEPATAAPQSWERFLIDAAVIGGRARWERRLGALAARLALARRELAGGDRDGADGPEAARLDQDLGELVALRAFALPLLDAMAALPARARWGEWIDRLGALATRALRQPERVLAVLAELQPMADVGPVELAEVRLVLGRRLADVVRAAPADRQRQILVAPTDAARGLSFDVVFVPGLAEKIFPQKVAEDPILRDDARRALAADLETTADRAAAERLALRLCAGAARQKLIVSYPRLDLEQGRPRVPSFYALELLRATTGSLPGFDELAARAERIGAARVGWPAPASPDDAIDEAEHDLSILEDQVSTPRTGVARYLLGANVHLARALRVRARRWIPRWTRADGLYDPIPEARAVLDRHTLAARSFSATALQQFAACPYRFFLHTVHRLAPREVPERIEEIDPLSRGSLVHEVQFLLFSALRDEGALPITPQNLDVARARLDQILDERAAHYRDELAPAIDRVWDDGVAAVRADLREWLRLWAERDSLAWTPWRFEMSFGLPQDDRRARDRDPSSRPEPVPLDCGIRLRGAIDLVEARRGGGSVRATDHKTGRVRARKGSIIGGGEHLQPVLYALALEKLLPGTTVESGRLYYCTHVGTYSAIDVTLDENARAAAGVLANVVGAALERGELPAAPAPGACEWCNYRQVCGPDEEARVRMKNPEGLVGLERLRRIQ